MKKILVSGVEVLGKMNPHYEQILTDEALSFLQKLHRKFNSRRHDHLKDREKRQQAINKGSMPTFLQETDAIRNDESWKVVATPEDIKKRWVEITGPTDRKMVINALNSGANVFMADFEDANSPTWENMVEGQINLKDAVNETISLTTAEGKEYTLKDKHAVLFVRPRGWHLNEKHVTIDEIPISGSLFDFGLYFFHNARRLLERGSGPYFYLPKLESHLEARLWSEVFAFSEEELGIPKQSIRATVLIETILAAFEMEEILYELKDYSAGLNAGRWDYIFSIIKKFRRMEGLLLPDRDDISMTVPFMRAYTELLVKTCHRRAAHAMGGMAAFIPNRKDPEVTERALKKVREDKNREATDGFDGTWVAHPDLVPVAREIFEKALKGKPNQKERLREDVAVTDKDLLNLTVPNGKITEKGVRKNVNVALQYLASWLGGTGAAAIFNLMEDAATAEISRAQLWQWLFSNAKMEDGNTITAELIEKYIDQELKSIASLYGKHFNQTHFFQAKRLLQKLIFTENFIEFLTLPAYEEQV